MIVFGNLCTSLIEKITMCLLLITSLKEVTSTDAPSLMPVVSSSSVSPTVAPITAPTAQPSYTPVAAPVSYSISFFVGFTSSGVSSGDNGEATSASVSSLYGVWGNTLGTVFLTDGNRVRAVNPSNIITTFAGTGAASSTGNGGAVSSANLNYPISIWGDSVGQIYVTEYDGAWIRRVSTSWIITTFAGTGTLSASGTNSNGDGGTATAATLQGPNAVFGDTLGVVYIADSGNYKIRRVSVSGIITTVAGTGASNTGGFSGAATSTGLKYPDFIYVDSVGNLFVSDQQNYVIRRIAAGSSIMVVVAGTFTAGFNGDGLTATATMFNNIQGIWLSVDGVMSAADNLNYRLRLVSSSDIVYTIAGNGVAADGYDGSATSSFFKSLRGIFQNTNGELFVCDAGQLVVRRLVLTSTTSPSVTQTLNPSVSPTFSPSYVQVTSPVSYSITFFAGATNVGYSTGDNGKATSASTFAHGMWGNTLGVIYFAERFSNTVRVVSTNNIVTTVAGIGTQGTTGNGGPASSATFNFPYAVWGDSLGQVYVVEFFGNCIRIVSTSLIINTFAGTGAASSSGDGGAATAATFNDPTGLSGDTLGNMYIADSYNHKIRRVSADGIVSSVAGTGVASTGGLLGASTSTGLWLPFAVFVVAATGRIYISDAGNCVLRFIPPGSSLMTAFVGTLSCGFNGDGLTSTSTKLNNNLGLWQSTDGNIFINDESNYRLRVVSSTQIVYTIAGNGVAATGTDNSAATSSSFQSLLSVFQNTNGDIYTSDVVQWSIRKLTEVMPTVSPSVTPTVSISTITPSISLTPSVVPFMSPSQFPSFFPSSSSPSSARSSQTRVTTIFGSGLGVNDVSTGIGGAATATAVASFFSVWGDTVGYLYVTVQHYCWKFSVSDNIVRNVAGTGGTTMSSDGGQATSGSLNTPIGLCVDTQSRVYIGDYNHQRVRLVSTSGIITTVVGTGDYDVGANGQATAIGIQYPAGVWVDSVGRIFMSNNVNHQSYNLWAMTIRRVDSNGYCTTFAGTGYDGYSGDGGPATSAQLYHMFISGVSTGIIYIADSNNMRIRKVDTSGIISTFLGNGDSAFVGDSVPASSATLYYPRSLIVDSSNGDMYISVATRVVVLTPTSNTVTTFAGSGNTGPVGDGGATTAASLSYAEGVYLDTERNLYIADRAGYRLRMVYTIAPSVFPTLSPSTFPTVQPSMLPSIRPTIAPSLSFSPSVVPTSVPSVALTQVPSFAPTSAPSVSPSMVSPTVAPTQYSIVARVGISGTPGFSSDGIQATSALLHYPYGIYLDSSGVLFFADYYNVRIRKVATDGIVSTIAGDGVGSTLGDGGPVSSASLGSPVDIWLDSLGQLFIAGYHSQVIRMVSTSQIITRLAGTIDTPSTVGTNANGDGGAATSATFNLMNGLSGDSVGSIYAADTLNSKVRKIFGGIITTFAGTGGITYSGDGLPATSAAIYKPYKYYLASSGVGYVSVANGVLDAIRTIDTTSIVATLIGASPGFNGDDLVATVTLINTPLDVRTDAFGNIIFTDQNNYRVRIISNSDSKVHTIAGNGMLGSLGNNGEATSASFKAPSYLAGNSATTLYVGDEEDHTIRMLLFQSPSIPSVCPMMVPSVTPSQTPTLVPTRGPTITPSMLPTVSPSVAPAQYIIAGRAGISGSSGYNTDGVQATSAILNDPYGICLDSAGVLYIAELLSNRIRKISTDGIIGTFAGNAVGSTLGDGGPVTSASLKGPVDIWLDSVGQMFIAGYYSQVIRMVSNSQIITRIAGTIDTASSASTSANGDSGAATSATFNFVYGISGDSLGGIYAADSNNARVRKIFSGIITTIAGTGGSVYSGNGLPATSAAVYRPYKYYLASDGVGYVSDANGSLDAVRTISTASIMSTLVGTASPGFNGDGLASSSTSVNTPCDIRSDAFGNLIFADRENHRVRMISSGDNKVHTIAGSGASGSSGNDGFATSAAFLKVSNLASNSATTLYVSDHDDHTVRMLLFLSPTVVPTVCPSIVPSVTPTQTLSVVASQFPSLSPSVTPTVSTSNVPSQVPTVVPSLLPTRLPSTLMPSCVPSCYPTIVPTAGPSIMPSIIPTIVPSTKPTFSPTYSPSLTPSACPSVAPSVIPSKSPSVSPSAIPTLLPSCLPSVSPSIVPSVLPSLSPTLSPSASPSCMPSHAPSVLPTAIPSLAPSTCPSIVPTASPSALPSISPSVAPSSLPTIGPSEFPRCIPTSLTPSVSPTAQPSIIPSVLWTIEPTLVSTEFPTILSSVTPTVNPTILPSFVPSDSPVVSSTPPSQTPSDSPSMCTSNEPSELPSDVPTIAPSESPSFGPSVSPSGLPTKTPTMIPSVIPSLTPTTFPTASPSVLPTIFPSASPSKLPSFTPSESPSHSPSLTPSVSPTLYPSFEPSLTPSVVPSMQPSVVPTLLPTLAPMVYPSVRPTVVPSLLPSVVPTVVPTIIPTELPTRKPTAEPTVAPTKTPTADPSVLPSKVPSLYPSLLPTITPSLAPYVQPTAVSLAPNATPKPSAPTRMPTRCPSATPTVRPSQLPLVNPTLKPTRLPSVSPTLRPSRMPSVKPSAVPTVKPTARPSVAPTSPTVAPSQSYPSISPSPTVTPSLSSIPTTTPSENPTVAPTEPPTALPSSVSPSATPSIAPTVTPSAVPTNLITVSPSTIIPSAAPSSLDFYVNHPKATLPSNQSISVLGVDTRYFKIVLPFLAMSSGSSGVVFNDIKLLFDSYGLAYILLGSGDLSGSLTIASGAAYGTAVGIDSSKRAVSLLGDVNNDGFNDIIVGDPYVARCYVMFGNSFGLVNMAKGFTIFGEQDSDLTGWSVSDAGDVNNDTLADIIVGAPFVNGVGGFYVIYGRKFNCFDVYLNNLTASEGFAMYGAQKSDYLGISVSNAGDVNKDGFDDVVAGGVMTSQYFAGAAYLVYGGRNVQTLTSIAQLSSLGGCKYTGIAFMYAGYSVSGAGDVNRDGYDDVLIGSCPQKSQLIPTAYVVFGSKPMTGGALSSLIQPQGIRITGGGIVVASAGNVNHDGYSDMLIGGGYTSVSDAGYVVFTNMTHMTQLTSKPSNMPSFLPSFAPTVRPSTRTPLSPSVSPSRRPSELPTVVPTTPTFEPTVGVSQPTSWPSSHPTLPTIVPSEVPSESPTELPSAEPSEMPSMVPSEEPSETPSTVPSDRPSEMPTIAFSVAPSSELPTVPSMTRGPYAAPSVVPTVESAILVPFTRKDVSEPGSLMNETESHVNYVVNATGAVTVLNGEGFNKYSVVPTPDALLTIIFFDKQSDLIDLSLFTSIASFTQLHITEGSAIISLPSQQTIHILNLHPADMLESNFIFYVDQAVNHKKNSIVTQDASQLIGLCVGFGVLSVIVWFAYRYYRTKTAVSGVKVEDFFIFTLRTNLDGSDIESGEMESEQQTVDVLPSTRHQESLVLQSVSSLDKLVAAAVASSMEDAAISRQSSTQSIPSPLFSFSSASDERVPVSALIKLSRNNDGSESVDLSDHTMNSEGELVLRVKQQRLKLDVSADSEVEENSAKSEFSIDSDGLVVRIV